jgi:hypothetical protein
MPIRPGEYDGKKTRVWRFSVEKRFSIGMEM